MARVAINLRSIWQRTNSAAGFKLNQPEGWASEGPVWWNGSDAFLPTESTQGFAAVTKAESVIVNRIATAHWNVKPDGPPRWVTDPMLTREDDRYPSPAWPAALRLPAPYFWGQWIRSALRSGMGWLIFAEDSQGRPWPGSMHVLPFHTVTCPADSNGDGPYRRIEAPNGSSIDLDADNRFELDLPGDTWRLLELRNPTTPLNASTGITPGTLPYHAAELGLLPAIAEYTYGTYRGSGVPSGFLKVNSPQLTKERADELKNRWLEQHGTGRRSVAVLTSMIDYTPISYSPVDAAVADMKRLSLVDVANAYCVPIFMLGGPAGHSNMYSNVQMEQQSLWTHTIQPWAKSIEATVSCLLPQGTDLEISMPSLEEITQEEKPKPRPPKPMNEEEGVPL